MNMLKEDIISKNNILIHLGNLYLALFILMILFGALGFFILLSYTQKCKCSQCFLPFYCKRFSLKCTDRPVSRMHENRAEKKVPRFRGTVYITNL